MSETAIHRMVAAARLGDDPRVIARMSSGWAVMGERQVVDGYSLLLPDPVVPHLNSLDATTRVAFLDDMARLGDAVLAVTAASRINYEILGNLEPALHAHVIPRRADEPEALRARPIWFFDWDAARRFDPDVDAEVRDAIQAALAPR